MKLLKWWLFFCVTITAATVIYYLGFFHVVWESDLTKLSFVIIVLFVLTSIAIGFKTWKSKTKQLTDFELDTLWFTSESMLTLGMIGTVAGFILMLGESFGSIDASNPETLKSALATMAVGMSTALYTTLIGLVCAQLTKVQLMNLEAEDS